jgi:hypothetical protein
LSRKPSGCKSLWGEFAGPRAITRENCWPSTRIAPTATHTLDYPKRWHVEEFFNAHQALGWKRAGTLNLNIRYGQMTMALVAQAVLHRTRRLLGEPYSTWDAGHFAKSLLAGLEDDIRVHDDTIVVTYYNAPNVALLREHYAGLPDRLESEHVDPHIPWLYGFKLDFCFR